MPSQNSRPGEWIRRSIRVCQSPAALNARAKITLGCSESSRGGIVTLPKIRNPKLEVRNKLEGPKSESQNQAASRRFEPWSFRVFNLFRISDFGFRICRASNGGWPGVGIPAESRTLFLHRPFVVGVGVITRRS